MSPDWVLLQTFTLPTQTSALCVHVDRVLGLVYVCAGYTGNSEGIYIFNTMGVLVGNITSIQPGTLVEPGAITSDSSHNIYVGDQNLNLAYKLSSSDHSIMAIYNVIQTPWGIYVDSNGIVYISGWNQNGINMYLNNGTLLKQFSGVSSSFIGDYSDNDYWGITGYDNVVIFADDFVFATTCNGSSLGGFAASSTGNDNNIGSSTISSGFSVKYSFGLLLFSTVENSASSLRRVYLSTFRRCKCFVPSA